MKLAEQFVRDLKGMYPFINKSGYLFLNVWQANII